jgi:transcriptional regulator with XRE-family HTH domain
MDNKDKTSYSFDNFGQRIKKLRMQKGLSQVKVAEALDVTPGYVSNVENNRTAMSLKKMIGFADLLNISLDELVGNITPDYKTAAVNHQLMQEISQLNSEEHEKLLKMIRIFRSEK